jgi:hypothetical protein
MRCGSCIRVEPVYLYSLFLLPLLLLHHSRVHWNHRNQGADEQKIGGHGAGLLRKEVKRTNLNERERSSNRLESRQRDDLQERHAAAPGKAGRSHTADDGLNLDLGVHTFWAVTC